jgi:hypothetical protein
MRRHSRASSFGRSEVGSAQQSAIRFAKQLCYLRYCNQWSFNQRLSLYLVRDWNRAVATAQNSEHRFQQRQGLRSELPDRRAPSKPWSSGEDGKWAGLRSMATVEATREIDGRVSLKRRYY